MSYPLISEYIEAIKSAEDNFKELSYLRTVLGDDGLPIMNAGGFSVVFKMKDERDGKLYAVKCFTKEQKGRSESYKLIADELEFVSSNYLTPIKYLERELFVDTEQSDETEFPVLLMDWVDGVPLNEYIQDRINDQYSLELLSDNFNTLAAWLITQPFSHGDLKPDNILIKEDGSLVLVDYDGMYVPAMKGQMAREIGSPNFRHPLRSNNFFDIHIDDFPIALIALSLKAIALNPVLWTDFECGDKLLFDDNDFRNINNCGVIAALQPLLRDKECCTLYGIFMIALAVNDISFISYKLFNLQKYTGYSRRNTIVQERETRNGVRYTYIQGLGLIQKITKANVVNAAKGDDFANITFIFQFNGEGSNGSTYTDILSKAGVRKPIIDELIQGMFVKENIALVNVSNFRSGQRLFEEALENKIPLPFTGVWVDIATALKSIGKTGEMVFHYNANGEKIGVKWHKWGALGFITDAENRVNAIVDKLVDGLRNGTYVTTP